MILHLFFMEKKLRLFPVLKPLDGLCHTYPIDSYCGGERFVFVWFERLRAL